MRGIAGFGLVLLVGMTGPAQTIHGRGGITLPPPPAVEANPVTDIYHGANVVDNYRWLEDAKSPETRAFIDAENAYTTRYLKQARIRPQVVDALDSLDQVDSWTIPIERAGNYYFEKRLADENQASIYMRRGWTGKDQRIIDPAAISRDPNLSIELDDVSRDGNLIAYGVREGGADETSIHVFNVKTGKTLFDELPSGLYWSINFTSDGSGLYYTRDNNKGTLLWEHVLGTRSYDDKLIFGRAFYDEPLGPNDLFTADVSDDGHYLVVTVDHGVPAKRVDILFRDLTKPDSPFQVLVWGLDSRFSAIYAKGAWYVKTDYKAPNGRILEGDPGVLPDVWKVIAPETQEPIESFSIVGGKVYVVRLKNASSEISIYGPDGKAAGAVDTTGIGTVSTVYGRTADRFGFFSYESFIQPPTIYRLDTMNGKREVFAQPKVPFDSSQYEVKQVFYKSKDGTRIPMFIAGRKGLKPDGTERLLMTAYGGFDISETPYWSPQIAWWMQQGGWFALPNLRGGGEYGERWHEQGMFGEKQNVFDDFYAAAKYLIANKYTSPEHFAITGRSNGGLLMGAAMTQHPELFSAILCGYPLLDMLRYQKFEQGSHWITEYGTSDNAKQFPYLLKYSPYENVQKGTAYPAVMFFAGANDTRVDPLHARKMTALMQADSSSGRPILLYSSVARGHSAGVSVEQSIQDDADQLTFLWTETGNPTPSSKPATQRP